MLYLLKSEQIVDGKVINLYKIGSTNSWNNRKKAYLTAIPHARLLQLTYHKGLLQFVTEKLVRQAVISAYDITFHCNTEWFTFDNTDDENKFINRDYLRGLKIKGLYTTTINKEIWDS